MGTWDVTAATNFDALLKGLANFNEDLTGWDTSGVTTMGTYGATSYGMFEGADVFNQPVPFDTSSVTDMQCAPPRMMRPPRLCAWER